MRMPIRMAVFLLLCLVACDAAAQPDKSKITLADSVRAELGRLPDGILVSHAPNPVSAVEDSIGGSRYAWKYATTVSAPAADVTIIEFGMLSKAGEQWIYSNYTGKPFGAKEFEAWYGCTGARLQQGRTYSDPSNWSASGCLRKGICLWYFIGEDESGNRVKGGAELVQLPEIVGSEDQ